LINDEEEEDAEGVSDVSGGRVRVSGSLILVNDQMMIHRTVFAGLIESI
jgi:hypothetical protein